ncbi:transcription repressor NadR [Acidaminococcus sp. DS4831]|uniref:transcription repressor NadR n=1 Tax=Acidaminococcus sp. DS4831 TaxID=3141399 RepID=UPI0032E51A85
MNNQMRREKLYKILEDANRPVTGIELSKDLGVTRQIIVGDVAILRSSGKPIISTARGYLLQGPLEKQLFHCCSKTMDEAELVDELNAVVDNGGIIQGITLSHEVYGTIHIEMNLRSRRDIQQYVDKLRSNGAPLIITLTNGVHILKVATQSDEEMDGIKETLQNLGILEQDKK